MEILLKTTNIIRFEPTGWDAYEQLFNWKLYRRKLLRMWLRLAEAFRWMWRCRFLQSFSFLYAHCFHTAQIKLKKGANTRTTETKREIKRKKEMHARKKTAHEYLPASHCYVHDHFFVIQRFWSAEDHDTPCLTLGCFMN